MTQIDLTTIIKVSAITSLTISFIVVLINETIVQWIREKFKVRELNLLEKREFANELIKICTEGQSSGWTKLPRNQEHVWYLLNRSINMSNRINELLVRYVGSWITKSSLYVGKTYTTYEQEKFFSEVNKELRKLVVDLISEANKLKK